MLIASQEPTDPELKCQRAEVPKGVFDPELRALLKNVKTHITNRCNASKSAVDTLTTQQGMLANRISAVGISSDAALLAICDIQEQHKDMQKQLLCINANLEEIRKLMANKLRNEDSGDNPDVPDGPDGPEDGRTDGPNDGRTHDHPHDTTARGGGEGSNGSRGGSGISIQSSLNITVNGSVNGHDVRHAAMGLDEEKLDFENESFSCSAPGEALPGEMPHLNTKHGHANLNSKHDDVYAMGEGKENIETVCGTKYRTKVRNQTISTIIDEAVISAKIKKGKKPCEYVSFVSNARQSSFTQSIESSFTQSIESSVSTWSTRRRHYAR